MKPKQQLSNRLRKLGLVSLLILGPCLIPPAGAQPTPAQDTNAVVDFTPLQPPDTSSPRDTLHSFLTNVNTSIQAFVQNAQNDVSDRAGLNASRTLDYSATPDSDAWSVQTERMLLLKEILDRIELPPDNEIPGDDEVADGSITRWTIPETRITIARVGYGLREGEFLFSPATVERLDRSYQLVRELPYKPSVSIPGVYESWSSTYGEIEKRLRNRLMSVNTSSPRATLMTFFDLVNRAHTLVTNANNALKAEQPTLTKTEARKIETRAINLLRRATATLDLSKVPQAHRNAASIEAVIKLKEILDRTLPPRLGSIPDAVTVANARHRESRSFLQPDEPFRWRYPNSEIEIAEIMEGDRQGEFLFSSRTVRQINGNFQRVRLLPYAKVTRGRESRLVWADQSPGFYNFIFTSPGDLIPRLSFLGGLVESLPLG